MIHKDFQNRGFGSLALQLVEKEARKLRIKKLIALIKPENKSKKTPSNSRVIHSIELPL